MSVREKYAHLPPLPGDIRERLGRLPALFQKHPVRLAYLFGSALREPTQSHDIDLAVLPAEGFSYLDLYADLSQILNTDRLDLLDLRLAPSYLQAEIVTTGRCLFAQSEEERLKYALGCRMRWREDRRRWISKRKEAPMPIQEEFILQALAELRRTAQELEHYQTITHDALTSNLSRRWAVEHGLLVGLTLIFQVADHILTHAFERTVSTYEGLITELRACGVISADLASQLRGAGGFRNVLVHEYLQVDLNTVLQALRRAPAIDRQFITEIEHWLAEQASL